MSKAIIVCKNCANHFTGNYCNQCGQDAHTGRINSHFLIHEIQHGLFHIDKGIFYTIKQLFIHPGHTLREFIEGKRVAHFKPLSFLIVIAGLYAFVHHFLKADVLAFKFTNADAQSLQPKVTDWMNEHFALVSLLEVPLIGFISYLFFKKYKVNYMENLVISAYLIGQRIIAKLVLLPFFYIHLNSTVKALLLTLDDFIIPVSLFIWAYKQYFEEQSAIWVMLRSFFTYLISYALVILVISVVYSVVLST